MTEPVRVPTRDEIIVALAWGEEDLDAVGEPFGFTRGPGEDDDNYRDRLWWELLGDELPPEREELRERSRIAPWERSVIGAVGGAMIILGMVVALVRPGLGGAVALVGGVVVGAAARAA